MRHVVVATHGHCFDGMCSAVMFTRLMRHIHPGEELSFTYRAQGYGPGSNGVDPAIFTGQENAILDFRFSQAPQLTWYFDHHVSAFPSPADRLAYDDRAKEGPSRTMFHDGGYGSCTKLIADIGRQRFGLDVSGDEELVRWADMIDSAAFPSAEMAVARAEPVLHLMTVVEHHGGDAFLQTMVPRLLEEPLVELAKGKDVEEAYAPLAAQHEGYVELVKKHATVRGPVVVVDLGSVVVDVGAKVVTYSLWAESAYSVVLSCSPSKCKISIGYNPWSPVERRHNIAAICERHGGGGHPVVGAISLPADQIDRARKLTNEIAEELAT
ncbi:MAG: Exopolyphosphatase-related protein [Labilithrix sp.]|nr:Exopolyphosphatase-related protein [Labilithrix sp.]